MSLCPHCEQPVREAIFQRTGRLVRLDMETAAIGNLRIDALGFVSFIPQDARFPKHVDFVPPEQRYVSHRATCARNERAAADVSDIERALKVVR